MTGSHGFPAGDEVLEVPDYAPLDPFSRSRIRNKLVGRFGEFATLDLHVDLLDRRGAWYLEQVMDAWPADEPDSLFAVAHNVVRTQMPGPSPAPNLDAWLQAGRPTSSPLLAALWEYTNARIDPDQAARRHRDADPEGTDPTIQADAAKVDALLIDLDDTDRDVFLAVYVALGASVRSQPLPPIGT